MLIEDLLKGYKKNDLLNFYDYLNIKNKINDKDNLIKDIKLKLLDESYLKDILVHLPKVSIDLIEQLISSKVKIYLTKSNYIGYKNAKSLFLIYKDEDGKTLQICNDLLILLKSILKRFKEEYKIKHHILICLKYANDFYGVYKGDELDKLIMLNNISYKSDLGKEYLISLVGKNYKDIKLPKETKFNTMQLMFKQAGKGIYIPTINEMEEYYSCGYISTKEINEFLDLIYSFSKDTVYKYFIARELQKELNLIDSKESNIIVNSIINKFNIKNEENIIALKETYKKAYNSGHMLINKGNTMSVALEEKNKLLRKNK